MARPDLEGTADEQGVLLIYQDYDRANSVVALGPTPDALSSVCFACTTVPVPAGWSFRVTTTNARSSLAIRWLGPAGSTPTLGPLL